MNFDISIIDINNIDVNSLTLPEIGFKCFIICNYTKPNEDLLLKLIERKVKEISTHGKYGSMWEESSDRICVKYKKNNKKPSGWVVLTSNNNLNSFINFITWAHNEFFDDETNTHNPIVLFYDDESLKDYVLERVDSLLEKQKTN